LLIGIVIVSGIIALKHNNNRKKFIFQHFLLFCTVVVSVVLLEIGSSFFVPKWPAREIRPIVPNLSEKNSWGVRDCKREIKKEKGIFRVIFIGDSFLEGGFCRYPLSWLCEKELHNSGDEDIECINLGISGTGLKHYYYRFKYVGKNLQPDLLALFFYMGNDFITPDK